MKQVIGYVVTVEAVIESIETAGLEWAKTTSAPDAPYGYTPEIQKLVRREVQLLKQRLDALDMRALAAVLNGLPLPQSKQTFVGEIK